MLLPELEVFVQVATYGTVGGAARMLSISQPVATSRIQGLERELGVQLFTRSNRGMRLSEAGMAFLPYARRTVEAAREAARFMHDYRSGATSPLILGCSTHTNTYLLPGFLRRYRAFCPQAEVVIRSAHTEDVLEWVLRREVEMGLVREVEHPDVVTVLLHHDEIVPVASRLHALATQPNISATAFGEAGLVQHARPDSFLRLARTLFSGTGVEPRIIAGADTVDGAKAMVDAGFGLGILPKVAVRRDLARGNLVRLKVTGLNPAPLRTVAIRHEEHDSGRTLRFLAAIGTIPDTAPNATLAGS